MNILFLDMDGVMNSSRWYYTRKTTHPNRFLPEGMTYHDLAEECHHVWHDAWQTDPAAVALLKRLVEQYDVKIVLSSTWRRLSTPEELKRSFKLHGWEDIPLIGYTPYMDSGYRGSEIDFWMMHFDGEITRYAIIDDDSDMLEGQMPFFVNTKHGDGLTFEKFRELEAIYKEDPPKQFSLGLDDYSDTVFRSTQGPMYL